MSGESPPDRGRAVAATLVALVAGGALVGLIYILVSAGCGAAEEATPRVQRYCFGESPLWFHLRNFTPLMLVLLGGAIATYRRRVWPVLVSAGVAAVFTLVVILVLGPVPV